MKSCTLKWLFFDVLEGVMNLWGSAESLREPVKVFREVHGGALMWSTDDNLFNVTCPNFRMNFFWHVKKEPRGTSNLPQPGLVRAALTFHWVSKAVAAYFHARPKYEPSPLTSLQTVKINTEFHPAALYFFCSSYRTAFPLSWGILRCWCLNPSCGLHKLLPLV